MFIHNDQGQTLGFLISFLWQVASIFNSIILERDLSEIAL